MPTHYSILSALIRPEIQEKITIGMLLMDEDELYFDYSKNKLAIAKTLLSNNGYISLKDALHNIETAAKIQQNKKQPVIQGMEKLSAFKKSYIDYLSRYNNNLLSFSSPKKIETEATAKTFAILYSKFIDNTAAVSKPKFISTIEKFKEARRPVLSKHFNIDEEITHKEVPNLIVPVTITLIGQNEAPTFVQSVDMERSTNFLTTHISEILFLQKAFSSSSNPCVAMAITNEPDKNKFPEQHDIWQQLRKTSDIKNYDISEADGVIAYAEEYGLQPFLKAS
jgi:hypothetical protein